MFYALCLLMLRTGFAAYTSKPVADISLLGSNISSIGTREYVKGRDTWIFPWEDDTDDDEPGLTLYTPMLFAIGRYAGEWGEWEYCPNGTYASGFQLRSELGRDDTALNSIKLFCVELNSNDFDKYKPITSKQGTYGIWGNVYQCLDGVFNGFSLKQQKYHYGDLLGATNLKMMCSNSDTGIIEGDGFNRGGAYFANNMCGKRQAICGLKTQVDVDPYSGDKVALNNIGMRCCPIVDSNCTAKDDWTMLRECENHTNNTLTCGYTYERGVSTSTSMKSSLSWKKMESIGFDVGIQIPVIKANFKASGSHKTGTDWSTLSVDNYQELTSVTTTFSVPPMTSLALHQVIGSCGNYKVGAASFRVENS